jgi:hypothetical protein
MLGERHLLKVVRYTPFPGFEMTLYLILFRMLWRSVISPWLFAPPPENAVDEKKQKKLDRKMRRAH